MSGGHGVEHLQVQPLVDHPEISQTRSRDRSLVGRLGNRRRCAPGLREVTGVDAARKARYAGVPCPLGLVEARAAGENEVGAFQQRCFPPAQLGRGSQKERQLVHAVIDHERGIDGVQERLGHRRVHPADRAQDPLGPDESTEELRRRRENVVWRSCRKSREPRACSQYTPRWTAQVPSIRLVAAVERLLHEENWSMDC